MLASALLPSAASALLAVPFLRKVRIEGQAK